MNSLSSKTLQYPSSPAPRTSRSYRSILKLSLPFFSPSSFNEGSAKLCFIPNPHNFFSAFLFPLFPFLLKSGCKCTPYSPYPPNFFEAFLKKNWRRMFPLDFSNGPPKVNRSSVFPNLSVYFLQKHPAITYAITPGSKQKHIQVSVWEPPHKFLFPLSVL